MKRERLFALTVWGLTALVLAGRLLAAALGLYWNTTASVPVGLWRVSDEPPRVGDVVLVCPPDTALFRVAREVGAVPQGTCPGGYTPLLKPVAAAWGDTVELDEWGVSINGFPIENTRAIWDGSAARVRPYALGRYVVDVGEVWLISSFHPRSFDSRYFGPIPSSCIKGVARQVFAWGSSAPMH